MVVKWGGGGGKAGLCGFGVPDASLSMHLSAGTEGRGCSGLGVVTA